MFASQSRLDERVHGLDDAPRAGGHGGHGGPLDGQEGPVRQRGVCSHGVRREEAAEESRRGPTSNEGEHSVTKPCHSALHEVIKTFQQVGRVVEREFRLGRTKCRGSPCWMAPGASGVMPFPGAGHRVRRPRVPCACSASRAWGLGRAAWGTAGRAGQPSRLGSPRGVETCRLQDKQGNVGTADDPAVRPRTRGNASHGNGALLPPRANARWCPEHADGVRTDPVGEFPTRHAMRRHGSAARGFCNSSPFVRAGTRKGPGTPRRDS